MKKTNLFIAGIVCVFLASCTHTSAKLEFLNFKDSTMKIKDNDFLNMEVGAVVFVQKHSNFEYWKLSNKVFAKDTIITHKRDELSTEYRLARILEIK